MRYQMRIKAESPLVITQNRGTGNQLDTLHSIPGTTWRGALAQEIIGSLPDGVPPEKDPTFRSLFLEGRVRFGNLTPNGERLLPLSARVCADHRDDHPVRDLLLLRFLGQTLPRECKDETGFGKRCDSKLTPHEGFVSIGDFDRPERKDPDVRVTAHTAISNATLRVRDEQFYSSMALERRTAFVGSAWALDTSAETAFEGACASSPWFALGRGRTRGQGHALLTIDGTHSAPTVASEEIALMNRPFVGRQCLVFTVTLASPCIVYDKWGLSRPYLLAEDIAEAAGLDAGELAGYELKDWFSRAVRIGGWNAQAGLPKADVSAIAAGSAFLFSRPFTGDDVAREGEYNRLAGIFARVSGIGEKWSEGFGEAVFCDPIHRWKESA